MNLSDRLDAARAAREKGETDQPDRSVFDLRMKRDEQTYDGTDFRTGEPLTDEQRERLAGTGELPSWNPRRANEDVSSPWRLDPPPASDPEPASGTPEPIGETGSDNVFEMPAWARGAKVYRESTADPPATRPVSGAGEVARPTCPTCSAEGRVTQVDLQADEARLECRGCGFRWTEQAHRYAGPEP